MIEQEKRKMNQRRKVSRRLFGSALAFLLCAAIPAVSQAQTRVGQNEMEKLVARVALYPDALLAQVMMAASYPDQIPEAAKWSDQHHYLSGAVLAKAIADDHLSWDPSVQALLPFPTVLDLMAGDMAWTSSFGTAVLVQRNDVMEAVQRMRHKASQFGYLKSTPQLAVGQSGIYITIRPILPDGMLVPIYDPAIAFAAPAPGLVVGTVVNLTVRATLGPAFRPWWSHVSVSWEAHYWFVGEQRWDRTWANRMTYVPRSTVPRYTAAKRVEGHELIVRSEKEKTDDRLGQARAEEHKK
jgi:hypothetical protein